MSLEGLNRPWAGGMALWLASTATLGLLPRRPTGATLDLARWIGRTAWPDPSTERQRPSGLYIEIRFVFTFISSARRQDPTELNPADEISKLEITSSRGQESCEPGRKNTIYMYANTKQYSNTIESCARDGAKIPAKKSSTHPPAAYDPPPRALLPPKSIHITCSMRSAKA